VAATVGTSVTDILDTDTFDNGCAALGNMEATVLGVLDIALGIMVLIVALLVVSALLSLIASIISANKIFKGNIIYNYLK